MPIEQYLFDSYHAYPRQVSCLIYLAYLILRIKLTVSYLLKDSEVQAGSTPALCSGSILYTPRISLEEQADVSLNFYFKLKLSLKY